MHQSVDIVEKRPNGTNSNYQNGGTLILKCKDLRILQLDIGSTEEFLNVYASIERLSNLDSPLSLYPFFYRPMYNIIEDGHTLFSLEMEFAKLLASDDWRISTINKDYSVCPTYSANLLVPKAIDDETILAAANFRDGGRFPVLSYRHENGAVLLRSSQPLIINNRRCRADEKILNHFLGINKKGYLIETRSPNMVAACKAKGGGTEPDEHYPQWRRIYKNLDRIANCKGLLLDSFQKFMDACNDTNCTPDKWISRVDSSNWLTLIQNTLNAACFVAQCLDKEGASILVHGSHGMDSTLLVTSIAQVILNPDCRTVRGLQALIAREWLQGGYPFQTRHGKFCYSNMRNKNQQPTFLLFLDCVQQLHYQFPCSFEFTTQMLIILFEHSYFSQFGTFLGNCDADREKMEIARKTTSLWSYLNRPDILTSLLNPVYEPNKCAIWPSVAAVSLNIWGELYHRWIIDQSHQKKAMNRIHTLVQNDKKMRSKVIKLRNELLDLHRKYSQLNEELDDTEIQNVGNQA